MPYSFENYWSDLGKAITDFDKENKIEPSSKEDKAAYELQKKTLSKLKELGELILTTWNPLTKNESVKQLNSLSKDAYGESELPSICGAKSLEYVQKVYLPHLKRFNNVTFTSMQAILSTVAGTSEEDKKKNASARAKKLEDNVKTYLADKSAAVVVNKNFFSESQSNTEKDQLKTINDTSCELQNNSLTEYKTLLSSTPKGSSELPRLS